MRTKKALSESVSFVNQNQHPESLLLDVHKAAALLGVPTWTVRRLVWKKELLASKLNGKLFLSRSAVLAFVERVAAGAVQS
jgi:excisionase family DNA binding protein